MLFESLGQGWIFIIVIWIGLIAGCLDEMFNLVTLPIKNIKFIQPLVDTVRVIIICLIFFISVQLFNYGDFRLYLFLSFLIGFTIEKKYLRKSVAKIFINLYNYSVSINKKIWSKFKNATNNKKNKY